MLNVFLLLTNTFFRLVCFLAWLIPQLLQKSRNREGSVARLGLFCCRAIVDSRPRPRRVVGMDAQCASMPPRRRDTSRRVPLRQQGRGGWPQRGNPACPPKLLPRGYPLHSLCCVKPKSWKFSYFAQHCCIFCSYAFRRMMHSFSTPFSP